MHFQYDEEQQLLADSIGRLVEKDYDFEARKRAIASARGYSDEVWQELADMGILALPFAESNGGFGKGAMDMIATMEAVGRGLLVEPYLPTVALAGRLVERVGSEAQRAAILPGVIDGNRTLAFAHGEPGSRYALAHVEARAEPVSGGWRLSGAKTMVLNGAAASHIVVSARTAGAATDADGISLFLVPNGTKGLMLKTQRTVDNLRAADIALAGAIVPADALLGATGKALPAIEEAVDFATVLLCAEAVGAMKYANEATLEYLKTRKQFGLPIGAFQALQHRMVDMNLSAIQARSITLLSCSKFDAAGRGEIDATERKRMVSAAKYRVAEAARHVGQEAIQLHGGMGMTQEMKVAHTFKRLTMIAQAFGDADHHLERYVALG